MPLYMAQFAYTVDAWAAFTKNPENRTAALQDPAKKVGAKVEALYYSFGDYDGFVIIDAPDEATVTAMLLAAIAPGHLRATKTTVLMRPETMVASMKKAGEISSRGTTPAWCSNTTRTPGTNGFNRSERSGCSGDAPSTSGPGPPPFD
jgi:uncharacterized protein with GYD domain